MNLLRKDLISVYLLLVGTLVCLFAILSVRGITIAAESMFGRMNHVPFIFWIGFFVAIIGAFIVTFSTKPYHMISIILITMIIWYVPTLMDLMPREHDTYEVWATSEWIYKHGHIRFDAEGLDYLQYPAVFLLGTTFKYILAIDPLIFLLFIFPAIFTILWPINFYIVVAHALNSPKKAYIATLVPTIANIFQNLSHFSPLCLATSFFPLVLFLVFKKHKTRLWIFVLLFGFLTYITFHPILPLLILVLSLVFLSFTKITGQISERFGLILFLIFLVGYMAWSVFIGTIAFYPLVKFCQEFITNISSGVFIRRLTESYGTAIRYTPLIISVIRWAITLFFVVPSFILIIRNGKKRVDWISLSFLSTLFLAFGVGMTTFGLSLAGRILFLLIPLSSLIIVRHLKSTRYLALFLAIVIMLSPLSILTWYHTHEIQHIVTKAEYEGGFFLASILKEDDELLMDFIHWLPFFSERLRNQTLYYSYYDLYNLSLVNKSTTVLFSFSSFRRYCKIEGRVDNSLVNAELHLMEDPTFNKIYDSWDTRIFKR